MFFCKKEYFTRPATKLTTKLQQLLCLECSIWQIFFEKSLTNSITALFRRKSLSERRNISGFFCLVINSIYYFKRSSNSFLETYPLSANNLQKRSLVKWLMTFRSRSSTLHGVFKNIQDMLLKFYVQLLF